MSRIYFCLLIPLLLIHCSPSFIPNANTDLVDYTLLQNTTLHTNNYNFTITITDLNLDDSTDLSPAFSNLYVALVIDGIDYSTLFISIEDFMYDGMASSFTISPKIKNLNHSKAFNICIVSGQPQPDNYIKIINTKTCKKFQISYLINNKEKEVFTLENKKENTPTLNITLSPST